MVHDSISKMSVKGTNEKEMKSNENQVAVLHCEETET
jgi:hypothetical protein